MKGLLSRVGASVALATLAACGADSALVGPAAAECATPPYFSVSPVALADIDRIVVFGGLGAPGHTLPTAQAGFYLATEGAIVRAPGAMQITGLRRNTYLVSPNRQGARDYAIDFQVCKQVSGWFGHLTSVAAAIPESDRWDQCRQYSTSGETIEACTTTLKNVSLAAGQALGTGGLSIALGLMGLDFGLLDSRVDNGYVAAWRHPPASIHATCGWDKFESAVRTQLYTKLADPSRPLLVPSGEPRCGTMNVDVAGSARGVWAPPTATTPLAGDETSYVTLANYPYRPADLLALSVGPATLGGMVGVVARGPATGRVNRPFELVTNDGVVYCYGPDVQEASLSWLVAMAGPSTLRIRRVMNPASNTCTDSPGSWTMDGALELVR